MGFFGNLKNAVTGGAATVQLTAGNGQRGGTLPVQVQATASADCKATEVYVLVRAVETVQIEQSDIVGVKQQGSKEPIRGRRVTYQDRIQLSPAQEFASGQSYNWEGEIALPADSNPSFSGQLTKHIWEMQAGLDMTGNDPDSGWIPIQVS